jgi:hypothetical protein
VDWFDWFFNPDRWKPIADLLGDWKTIGGGVITTLLVLWQWGARLFRWFVSKFRKFGFAKSRYVIGVRAVRKVANDACRWVNCWDAAILRVYNMVDP